MDVSDVYVPRVADEESFHAFDTDRVAEVPADRCNVTFHREGERLG